MTQKKLIGLLLVVVLIISSLVACAKPAPTPSPSPAPPAPPPAPSPTPPPVHEPAEIEILGFVKGASTYVLSFGLSDQINKYSPWLKAACMEWPTTSLVIFQEVPEKRKNTIINSIDVSQWMANKGMPPHKEPYYGGRAVSRVSVAVTPLGTLNPNIKTPQDLVGKSVMLMIKGTVTELCFRTLFEYWGIYEDIKFTYGGFDDAKSALIDGTVDAAFLGFAGVPLTPSPAATEAITAKEVYWISLPPEDMNAAFKEAGMPARAGTIPLGTYSGQTEEIYGTSYSNVWFCDEEMDEDIVYEICRILGEHYKEFGDYHPSAKGYTPQFFTEFALEEADFHPGAVKYYKEHGIPIGIK